MFTLLVGVLFGLTALGQPASLGSTYEVIYGQFTWEQAKADAIKRGGHLATITSQAEYEQIKSVLNNQKDHLWLGGYQLTGSSEPAGGWSWVTGEPWSFSAWSLGEPNNRAGENFLMIVPRTVDGMWNDAPESSKLSYLIEYLSPPDNDFITNGLVAYYPFNGNANDESGNKYTGTETGLTYTADRFSRNGSSPLFNGVSSVVHLPINNWATPEYSINCWVKGLYSENSEDLKGLVYSRQEGTDNINGLCFSPTGPWGPGFRADASSLEAWNLDHSTARNGNWWWAQIGNQPTLLDNNWRMITAVYRFNTKSPTIEIYHNGILIETSPAPKIPSGQITLSSLRIGTDHISRRTFKGNIDDVRLYARALDASQVKAIYNYESTPPDNNFITNGLVAYYPFNGNVRDESGNGNNGSALGVATSYGVNRRNLSGQALTLDGSTLVQVPNTLESTLGPSAVPPLECTITTWVKIAKDQGGNIMFLGSWGGGVGMLNIRKDTYNGNPNSIVVNVPYASVGGAIPYFDEWFQISVTWKAAQLFFCKSVKG